MMFSIMGQSVMVSIYKQYCAFASLRASFSIKSTACKIQSP